MHVYVQYHVIIFYTLLYYIIHILYSCITILLFIYTHTHAYITLYTYTHILYSYTCLYTCTDQEIRQAIVDMSFMRNVLNNVHSPVFNDLSLPDIDTVAPRTGPSSVEFRYELGYYCIV